MSAEVIPFRARTNPTLFHVEQIVEAQRKDIYERLAEAVIYLEDLSDLLESIARQTASGNMARGQLIKHLMTGADAARLAAKHVEG